MLYRARRLDHRADMDIVAPVRPRPKFPKRPPPVADEADFDHYIDGLEKAGVPEHPPAAD